MNYKNNLLIMVVGILVTTIHSQTPKPILYKSARELPSYLKLVKLVADLNKNLVIKKNKGANIVIVNRKKLTDNLFIKAPSLFAEGMNPEYAIPASRIIKDANRRVALLLNNNRIIPKKTTGYLSGKNF